MSSRGAAGVGMGQEGWSIVDVIGTDARENFAESGGLRNPIIASHKSGAAPRPVVQSTIPSTRLVGRLVLSNWTCNLQKLESPQRIRCGPLFRRSEVSGGQETQKKEM